MPSSDAYKTEVVYLTPTPIYFLKGVLKFHGQEVPLQSWCVFPTVVTTLNARTRRSNRITLQFSAVCATTGYDGVLLRSELSYRDLKFSGNLILPSCQAHSKLLMSKEWLAK